MMCFTDFIPDLNMQVNTGWAMLILIFMILAINLIIIFFYTFKGNYLLFEKYKNRLVHKFGKLKDACFKRFNIR